MAAVEQSAASKMKVQHDLAKKQRGKRVRQKW